MLVASITSTSRLKPEIRLAQAVSEFEAALPGEQKAEFRACRTQAQKSPPDISDVMRLTAEVDCSATRKGRRCFGPRMTNVLQAVQQFASIGDIIVGGSQNLIACGVWSLVRTTLLAVSQSGSYLEKLSNLFMIVGRSAPRYQALALLYARSKKLQGYLCEYFIAVVHLCQETANHVKKSALAQMSSNFVDSEFKKIQSELELWANSIKEEVTLLNSQTIEEEAQESSRFRGLVVKAAGSASYQREMEARLRWLDSLSTYDYVTTWKQARKKGTPNWFIEELNYSSWRNNLAPTAIFLRGSLGSGKTIIMASMIDDLILKRPEDITAYFFCRYDIPESLQARTVLGCLTRQIIERSANIDILLEEFGDKIGTLDQNALSTIFKHTLRVADRESVVCRVVLDGLDECEMGERQILIQFLRDLQFNSNFRVCISIRPGTDISLTAGYMNIPTSNPDIGEFIEAELEVRLESGKLSIGNAAIILEIRDALESGAQGMFLWVALQMDSICDEKTDDAIRKALTDLPRDLSEMFRRILRKSGLTNGTQYQQRILKHITAARRPLTTEELREILSVDVGVTTWNAAKVINNIYATLACCGSLITIDEEELTVRFAHHSVVKFLTGQIAHHGIAQPFPDNIGDLANFLPLTFDDVNNEMFNVSYEYQFTFDDANNEMGNIIVTYLNYGVFDTQVSRTVVPRIPAKETPAKIVDSVLGQTNGVKRLALRLLTSRKHTGYDLGKILSEMSDTHQEAATVYYLLPYAKAYWYHHTEDFSEKNSITMLGLWCRILQNPQVVCEIPFEVSARMYCRLYQYAYFRILAQDKSRLRCAIRKVILANRLNRLLVPQSRRTLFEETVRAVLQEIMAIKQLAIHGKALTVMEMVGHCLPMDSSQIIRISRQRSRQTRHHLLRAPPLTDRWPRKRPSNSIDDEGIP